MQREQASININNVDIAYTIKRSHKRRRSMSLGVTQQGVSINVPARTSLLTIERMLQKHAAWITKKLKYYKELPQLVLPNPRCSDEELQRAEKLLHERVMLYQDILGVQCSHLKIANQKTQWGSCNKRGVIRLNWRLISFPIEVIDYVVVHELCHLVYMNHSKLFWRLVEKVMPDYKLRRKALRQKRIVK